ncbi:hypothetical protein BC941DRAFT_498503 [Chlamydoabsidia padenii]|nr:hypothetical protein BC941DRAFT_498503 [Chlamydoabsidia padenii]
MKHFALSIGVSSLESNSNINLNCLDDRCSSMKDEMENLVLVSDGMLQIREKHAVHHLATIKTKEEPLLQLYSEQTSMDDGYCLPRSISHDSTEPTTINKYSQDSLHGFRFSSATRTDLAALRKRTMTRSIDLIKHLSQGGWKASETLPGHYSTTSFLASIERRRRRNKARSTEYTRTTPCYDTLCNGSTTTTTTTTLAYGLQPNQQQLRKPRRCSLSCIDEDTRTCSSPSTRTLSSSSSLSTSSTIDSSTSATTLSAGNTSVSKSTDGYDHDHGDSLDYQQPSLALFPYPVLHNPTRFLPQNQAILTTYDDWRIILSNNIASLILVGNNTDGYGHSSSLVGKSVSDYVDLSFRPRLHAMIEKRRQELAHLKDSTGMVLVCGNVVPIVKDDGTKSSASLWLKEKRNKTGSSVYIWIFEEVFETVTHVSIDAKGLICYVDSGIKELLDYAPESLMGKSIDTLIPFLSMNGNSSNNIENYPWQDINHYKYFGCRTRLGAHLPIITELLDTASNQPSHQQLLYTIRITSIPMIAGLITIRQDGIIEGCNDMFVKYMFGYSQEELVTGNKFIMDLMPQLPALLKSLRQDDLLQHGIIINNIICRKLIGDLDPTHLAAQGNKRLTQTPNGQTLPVLLAIHRDGTKFEIQLQLKLDEESDDGVCALWITFDRDLSLSRVGHKVEGPALEIKQHNGIGLPEAKYDKRFINEHDENYTDDDFDPPPPPSSPASSTYNTSNKLHQEPFNTKHSFDPETQHQQLKTEYIHLPTSSSNKSTTHDPSDYGGTHSGGSLSVSRPSCETDFPRVTTTFSRQLQQQLQPTSPLTPYSPMTFDGNRSHVLPEYAAQTRKLCIDDFEILDEIGQGAYGLVKLAVLKKDVTQKKVVIKYVIKSRILVDCWTRDRRLGMVPAEIHILHTLRKIPHDNCGDMVDYFEDDDFYYIVMELHGAGMDLFDYIEFKDTMHESEIRSIFKQIAMAVRHLHTHKIVHRDIKDENVVLDYNGNIRLIDFGSAAYLRPGRRYETFVGTLDYAAPEILRGQTYEGPPQDVWALGILLYTLIYRENPFYDIDEIMARELRVPYIFADGLPVDLIEKMLERNVDKRLTIHQVLEHPWLA